MFSRVKAGGALLEADAKRYFVHCLHALHYMHTSGVVHLDISLENVMLRAGDCCSLIGACCWPGVGIF